MADLPTATRTAKLQELQKRLQVLSIHCSQVGDTRPVSFCQFSPNSKLIATGSWLVIFTNLRLENKIITFCVYRTGVCKVWTVPDCELKQTLVGHKHQIGAVVFHPKATLTQDEGACNMASCSADGAVKLWNFKRLVFVFFIYTSKFNM